MNTFLICSVVLIYALFSTIMNNNYQLRVKALEEENIRLKNRILEIENMKLNKEDTMERRKKKCYIENKTLQDMEYEWRERYEDIMQNFHEHGYVEAMETLATYRYYREQASKYYHEVLGEFKEDCETYGIADPFDHPHPD